MNTYVITPAAGKRLMGKATAAHPAVQAALASGTVVIVAGTTNGYVAEEILAARGQGGGFTRRGFARGMTLPPSRPAAVAGAPSGASQFAGDVVLTDGIWQKGKTVFDVADSLTEGDIVLKGANALDVSRRRAAVLIGHAKGGTVAAVLQAVVGRRVRLILPVGLEKRVSDDLDELAAVVNAPGGQGPRLWPVPGEVLTEIEAIALLTGARARLVAGGGVCGAEGCVWLAVTGTVEEERLAHDLLRQVSTEPPFTL